MHRAVVGAAVGAAAAAAVAFALAPAVAGAGPFKKPVRTSVAVEDYFFGPAKLTLPLGSTVTWDWPVDGGDSHDVTLAKGPKGVKKFQSEVATAEYRYRHKFTTAGKYHIVCSLHHDMTMDITVR